MQTGTEISKSQKSDKKEKRIECHLTGITVSYCPNFNCMWSNKEGGCFFRAGLEAEDLGRELGMDDKEVAMSIRKGKSEITRFIIIDRYITFVKDKTKERIKSKLARKLKKNKILKELLKTSRIYPILKKYFLLDNFIIAQLCNPNYYAEFSSSLGIKPPNIVTLTGIREIYQGRIKDEIVRVRKTLSGRDKSKRQKSHKGKRK